MSDSKQTSNHITEANIQPVEPIPTPESLRALAAELAELKESLDDREEEIETREGELDDREEEIEEKESELQDQDELETERDELETERDELQTRLDNAQDEIETLTLEVVLLRQQDEQQQTMIQSFQTRNKELESKIKQQLQKHQKTAEVLKQQYHNMMEEQKQTIHELQNKIAAYSKQEKTKINKSASPTAPTKKKQSSTKSTLLPSLRPNEITLINKSSHHLEVRIYVSQITEGGSKGGKLGVNAGPATVAVDSSSTFATSAPPPTSSVLSFPFGRLPAWASGNCNFSSRNMRPDSESTGVQIGGRYCNIVVWCPARGVYPRIDANIKKQTKYTIDNGHIEAAVQVHQDNNHYEAKVAAMKETKQ